MPLPDSLQREMPRSRLGSAIPRSYGIAKDRLSKGAEGRGDGVAMVVVEERGGGEILLSFLLPLFHSLVRGRVDHSRSEMSRTTKKLKLVGIHR